MHASSACPHRAHSTHSPAPPPAHAAEPSTRWCDGVMHAHAHPFRTVQSMRPQLTWWRDSIKAQQHHSRMRPDEDLLHARSTTRARVGASNSRANAAGLSAAGAFAVARTASVAG